MTIDTAALRKHYSSLNDRALLDIPRDDLVSAAQDCLDAELHERGLDSKRAAKQISGQDGESSEPDDYALTPEDEPSWLPDASCAVSFTIFPGGDAAAQLDAARHALEAADVPCYAAMRPPQAEGAEQAPLPYYELLVPGALNLQALSVLDRDYYNPQTEEQWRAHLAALSDEDFELLNLPSLVAGMQDRIARLTSVYNDELVQRKKTRPSGW